MRVVSWGGEGDGRVMVTARGIVRRRRGMRRRVVEIWRRWDGMYGVRRWKRSVRVVRK